VFVVDFYFQDGKVSPITKFLDLCDVKLRTKILRQLKYVEICGLNQAIPNLRKLINTPLWEVRILGRDNIRIICGNLKDRKVVVLSIFRKKTAKTPAIELTKALERYKKVLDP